jgi:hypothetical protein
VCVRLSVMIGYTRTTRGQKVDVVIDGSKVDALESAQGRMVAVMMIVWVVMMFAEGRCSCECTGQ